MKKTRLISVLICLVLLLGLIPAEALAAKAKGDYDMPYYVTLDQTNQVVTVYRTSDDVIVRQMLCSAGKNRATVTGTYYMPKGENEMDRADWYYFTGFKCYAKYPTRIFKGILFHSITYNRQSESAMSKKAIEAFGKADSHGCIRLLVPDARWIQKNCDIGTKVVSYYSGTKDEELRTLLYQKSYSIDDGISYNEFWGLKQEEGTIGRYSSGAAVTDAQEKLSKLGYFNGEISGQFDDATIAAVLRFQGAAGVKKSGYIDSDTLKVLDSEDAPTAVAYDLTEGMLTPCVKTLQKNLTKLCLYDGVADGLYDYELIQAVNRFQTIYGYAQSDVCTMIQQEAIQYEVEKLDNTFGTTAYSGEVENQAIPMAKINYDKKIRMRADTDTTSMVVETLAPNESVQLIMEGEEWCQVKHGTNMGYVMTKYLKKYNAYLYKVTFKSADGKKTYAFGQNDSGESLADQFVTIYKEKQETQQVSDKQVLEEQAAAQLEEEALRGVVNTGSDDVRLNLRTDPDAGSTILAEIPNGTEVSVLVSNGDWAYVSYENEKGYLRSEYLDQFDKDGNQIMTLAQSMAKLSGDPSEGTVFTYDGFTWVYSSSNYKSEHIGYCKTGDVVKVYSNENGYCLVRYGKDFENTGYIPSDVVVYESVNLNTDESEAIDTTKKKNDQKIYAYVLDEVGQAYIYSEPKESSDTLTVMTTGKRIRVDVAEEDSDWIQVTYKKFKGYMRNSDVMLDLEG